MECQRFTKKIGIIGSGFVGTSFAYAAMIKNLASEILLYDVNFDKAEGEAMDLDHGLMFVETGGVKAVKSYEELQDADIIVITAGANQKPGETRMDLVEKNAAIMKEIIAELDKHASHAILIVVSNPVDILTNIAVKLSNRPSCKILGSGTVLDTSRFRYLLSEKFHVSSHSIGGYILGEHGDSEIAAWSTVNIGGKGINGWNITDEEKKNLEDQVRCAAYEIIKRKNATYYGIGLALCEIIESINYQQNMILPVSSLLPESLGFGSVCMSLPAVVSMNGIEKIIDLPLIETEREALKNTAQMLKSILEKVL